MTHQSKKANSQATVTYPHLAWIALGSNLGNPLQNIDKAISCLRITKGIRCQVLSPLYRSKPHGEVQQPDFINGVLKIQTELSPHTLLACLLKIENTLGRVRDVRFGPRVIDLDLIAYDALTCDDPTLTLPHPRAHEREFVIKPLYDLDPDGQYLASIFKTPIQDLRHTLPIDQLKVIRHEPTYYY